MKRTMLCLSICALAMPLSAAAAGGAYEINQDCAAVGCFAGDSAGFPVTITQPGSYVLTSDIAVTSASRAIDIQASPVDLDLNGHTLDGGGSCTGTPVTACSGAAGVDGIYLDVPSANGHIRLHNGTVRGFANLGIDGSEPGDGIVLEHLTIAENVAGGVGLVSNSYASILQVRDITFARNFNSGLNSQIKMNVENCTFFGNHSYGLSGNGGATIANSRFHGNGSEGIINTGAALDHNLFDHNNGGSAQWTLSGSMFDMGGNVCTDHACP